MQITYQQLIEAHEQRLTLEKGTPPSPQVLRNHSSVLNSFLMFIGKSLAHRIGCEFTFEFSKKAREFSDLVAERNRKTAADKLSILRSWERSVKSLSSAAKLKSVSGISTLHKELRIAVATSGQSVAEIAAAIKASPATLSLWMEGEAPTNNALPTLHRLEAHLGLERGYLTAKLEPLNKPRAKPQMEDDAYIKRHKQNLQDLYYLPFSDIQEGLRQEWIALRSYKTAVYPIGINRADGAVWRMLPLEQCTHEVVSNPLCHSSATEGSSTALKVLKLFCGYVGFLSKEKTRETRTSGMGLPPEQAQTLAMLAVPEFLSAYFEFMKARAGNITHSGHAANAGTIASLLSKSHGYLRQQPGFIEKVLPFANGRSWEKLCDEAHLVCQAWKKAGKNRHSRDPKLPLRHILSLERPLAPISAAIRRLDEAAANRAPGGPIQATLKRDALLLALFISNPLRVRTMTIAKYIPPSVTSPLVSNLYQADSGSWHLRFYKGDFKNDGSKIGDYDAPLPEKVSARIEEYVDLYRPILVRKNPEAPWLFVTYGGEQLRELGAHISYLAKRYIPEVPRMGAHALRHLVATDYLARNPDCYAALAQLLHDELPTVLQNYAHKKLENAFKSHAASLNDFFDGI